MKALRLFVLVSFAVILCISCSTTPEENVVEVTAKDFKFIVQDSIPSGWNTFRFNNTGHAVHFFLLDRLPDSIPFERFRDEVSKPFDVVFDSLKAGWSKEDALGMLLEEIPGWYFACVQQMGGSGIVSMGNSQDIALNLSPGTYVMECYIKEQGVFHTTLGMMRPIVVTKEASGNEPPLPNVQLTLTKAEYQVDGVFNKGINTVAVHFAEQPEFSPGNDVHIAKLTDETNLDSLIAWMDWMNIEGLQSPAPAEFFGGTQEMPTGNTSYFTTTLDSGQYVLIAESAGNNGLVQKFEIR